MEYRERAVSSNRASPLVSSARRAASFSRILSVNVALPDVDSNKRTPWPLIIKLTEGVVFLNRSDLGAEDISILMNENLLSALLTRLSLLILLPLLPSSSIKTHFFKNGWVK